MFQNEPRVGLPCQIVAPRAHTNLGPVRLEPIDRSSREVCGCIGSENINQRYFPTLHIQTRRHQQRDDGQRDPVTNTNTETSTTAVLQNLQNETYRIHKNKARNNSNKLTRKLDHTTKDVHGVPEHTQERHKKRELKRQTLAVAQFRRRLKCTQHYES